MIFYFGFYLEINKKEFLSYIRFKDGSEPFEYLTLSDDLLKNIDKFIDYL
jgi:hypothetical protein